MMDFFSNIVDVFQILFELINKTLSNITVLFSFVFEMLSFEYIFIQVLPSVMLTSFVIFIAVSCIKLVIGR